MLRLEPTIVGRFWSRLLEVEFVDRSVALAAKAFVSLFPLLIVFAALAPERARRSIVAVLAGRFGVGGDAFSTVNQAFASPDQTRAATRVIGVVLVVAYAISFTTALQRVYLRAWRRPAGGGARNKGRGLAWIGGLVAMLTMLTLIRRVLHGPAGPVTQWAVGLIAAIFAWWWTSRLMLRGEVRWRPLLPTAVVIGVGGWCYSLAASVWMPEAVKQNFQQFGAFGLALAFVSWFTGFAFLIVGAAVLGVVLAEGDDAIGRWLRAGQASPLEPSAAAPLPGRPGRCASRMPSGAVAARKHLSNRRRPTGMRCLNRPSSASTGGQAC